MKRVQQREYVHVLSDILKKGHAWRAIFTSTDTEPGTDEVMQF